MMQGPYSAEAQADSDDSMINAYLRSHSHTNFSHSKSKWLEEKLEKAAHRANRK